jgi:hypothetical protein
LFFGNNKIILLLIYFENVPKTTEMPGDMLQQVKLTIKIYCQGEKS